MEKLLSVKDICERYQFKDPRSARKIMRDMDHLECPLMVTERAVKEWETKNTLPPERITRQMMKRKGA